MARGSGKELRDKEISELNGQTDPNLVANKTIMGHETEFLETSKRNETQKDSSRKRGKHEEETKTKNYQGILGPVLENDPDSKKTAVQSVVSETTAIQKQNERPLVRNSKNSKDGV